MPCKARYRHELKYPIGPADYLAIRQRLRPVMRPDEHAGPDGRYVIRSIYFDTIDDKALREKVAGHLGSTDYRALAPGMRATFVKVVNQDLAPVLPRISAETLLVFGRNDQETPLWMGEALRDGIRGSALVVLENAGHFAYLEQCAAFLRIMDAFFFPEGKEAR